MLESFSFRGHRLAPAKGQGYIDDLFACNPKLRSLSIVHHHWDVRGMDVFLSGLGPSLTRVELDLDIFNSLNIGWMAPRLILHELDRIAPQVEEVRILDDNHYLGLIRPSTEVGEIVARMTSVRKLTVANCAVSDLAATIGPLTGLTELAFVQSARDPAKYERGPELIQLLPQLGSLARLALPSRSWRQWDDADKAALENVARGRNVALTIT